MHDTYTIAVLRDSYFPSIIEYRLVESIVVGICSRQPLSSSGRIPILFARSASWRPEHAIRD